MDATFSPNEDPALEELRREVIARRDTGVVHVEFRRLDARGASLHAVASAFVKSVSLYPLGTWTELDPEGALEIATRVLNIDLAYKVPMMTFELADALAKRFLAGCGDGAAFVSNGTLGKREGGSWFPITKATFDTGVIGVSSTRVGILWVEDED